MLGKKNAKKHKSFTKDKCLPRKQKITAASDIAKQEIDKPDCLPMPTDENGTENDICVFVSENDRDVLSHQLPENEKAVDDGGVAEKTNRIWEQMSLSPVWKMGQIKNVLDDNLFAQIIEDNNGFRSVIFCQRYRNGSFSPKMMISQSAMIMAALYIKNKNTDTTLNNGFERRVAKFKTDLCNEYLGKFRGGPEDAYDIVDIINALHRALPLLPVCSDDTTEQKRRELYWEIIERVDTYLSQCVCKLDAYYALTEEDVYYLAQDMKRDKLSLLREMREAGFLYIQSSASGFQSNIRLKRPDGTTYTEWRYCIYKIQYFMGESNGAKQNKFDLKNF